jgi:hypothetical protein
MSKEFDADLFVSLLLEDVVKSGRAGKNFVADPFELGPRLMALQRELETRPELVELDESDSQPPDEADPSQSSS